MTSDLPVIPPPPPTLRRDVSAGGMTTRASWSFLRPWWQRLARLNVAVFAAPLAGRLQKRYDRVMLACEPPEEDSDGDDGDRKHDEEDEEARESRHAARWGTYHDDRDAVELVMMLARVDPVAWKRMASEFLRPGGTVEWADFAEEEAPPTIVELWIDAPEENEEWPLALLSSFLTPLPSEQRKQDFRDARSRILAHCTDRDALLSDFVVPLRVAIMYRGNEDHEHCLEELIKLHAHSRHQARQLAEPHSDVFRMQELEPITFDFGITRRVAELTAELLRQPDAPSLCGVAFGAFGARADACSQYLRMITAAPCPAMTVAVAAEPEGTAPPVWRPSRGGCNSLDIGLLAPVEDMAALCSSLMHCQDVRNLKVSNLFVADVQDARVNWQWFLYALFSARATHAIRRLVIDASDYDVSEDFMRAAKELVETSHPLRLLNENTRRVVNVGDSPSTAFPTAPPSQSVQLAAGCTILSWMDNPNSVESYATELDTHPERQVLSLADDAVVDVMDVRDAWVDVLVPTLGRCCARLQDVAPASDPPASRLWNFEDHSVRALKIALGDIAWERPYRGLPDLIALVGAPLESLTIVTPDASPLSRRVVETVMARCTRLRTLELSGTTQDTVDEVIVPAFERGRCRISAVRLLGVHVSDAQAPPLLVQAMSDPTSPMAQHVRDLHLSLASSTTTSITMVNQFATMLKQNTTLRYLSVSLSENVAKDHATSLECFHGQPIHVKKRELDVRCRRAMLSVVRAAHDGHLATALGNHGLVAALERMDSVLLRLVFEFAAVPDTRVVVVRVGEEL
ncbi:hypothetical protein ATCC90586_000808 [Pythium insidiosum]|nr:hypothetical protein ATCC90586_000808 [Pythium insidiosum]